MLFIWPQDSKCMMSVKCKINFLVHPSPWANLRLGAFDSLLYYFLSKLTEKLFCAAARRMAEEGKQASSSIMLRPLWPGGIRIAKPGWSQSLCFGSLER